METAAENSGASPDPQDTLCQYCGEYDNTTDKHFERTLMKAINALTRLRRNPQRSDQKTKRQNRPCDCCAEYDHTSEGHFERSVVNAVDALLAMSRKCQRPDRHASPVSSNNQAALIAQEGGQGGRKNKPDRPPPAYERQRQQAFKKQQQQREVDKRPALTLQAHQHPQRQQQQHQQQLEVEQHAQGLSLSFPTAEQPHLNAHQQGVEGPKVLHHRDESHLPPPMEDEPFDAEDLLVFSGSADSDL
ncbi:hypothetical protein ABOM_001690 [Aspergillus bombycis]|uniref:Uncharacterized protein n=1 Tax=Aspergillus bombycis TaxID=109264 RepID=A0A1F8ADM7_9EURO|nr:hypothetical protein ABOM_001690 [Aspergillus bombycis]OGM49475.1 hypothetical protein ABOM_001690 [Aspergillus bombycis]